MRVTRAIGQQEHTRPTEQLVSMWMVGDTFDIKSMRDVDALKIGFSVFGCGATEEHPEKSKARV